MRPLIFFGPFFFCSAMHALGDISTAAHRNENASTALGVFYIACHMVLLYRFHDMDSMRDPHIYCNQHSDQNKACAINMDAMVNSNSKLCGTAIYSRCLGGAIQRTWGATGT